VHWCKPLILATWKAEAVVLQVWNKPRKLSKTLSQNKTGITPNNNTYKKQIQKQDPVICCLQETYFTGKDAHRLKIKEWKKDVLCKWKPK
jgi:hypothetical protein